MTEKLKKELRKMVITGAVGLAGILFMFFVVIPIAQKQISNVFYKMGADSTIKPTKECMAFHDRYIEEMQKKKEGHPMAIIEEAKKVGCKK